MNEAFQLKIYLAHSDPMIWREVIVNSNFTFFELHHTFQLALGWGNSHLFEFNLDGYRIGEIDNDFLDEGFGEDQLVDSRTSNLKDMITAPGDSFKYIYDFGDYWVHIVFVEKILSDYPKISYPVCIGGKMRCPPDDCGGIHSYYNYLEIIKDKNHEEYKEVKAWLGKSFDPNSFDLVKTNKKLINFRKRISKFL